MGAPNLNEGFTSKAKTLGLAAGTGLAIGAAASEVSGDIVNATFIVEDVFNNDGNPLYDIGDTGTVSLVIDRDTEDLSPAPELGAFFDAISEFELSSASLDVISTSNEVFITSTPSENILAFESFDPETITATVNGIENSSPFEFTLSLFGPSGNDLLSDNLDVFENFSTTPPIAENNGLISFGSNSYAFNTTSIALVPSDVTNSVPEPSSFAVIAALALSVLASRRRKKNRSPKTTNDNDPAIETTNDNTFG